MLPYGRKNPLPFLYSLSSPITTVPSKGKGEIYKRVENRRLSTLLYARAASAHSPPRGQKGRDTCGFPSSLNSYLSLVC